MDVELISKAKSVPQFASFCMEMWHIYGSGNPTLYISNFPVLMDCTCNGFQHMAALVRDETVAPYVNLIRMPNADKEGPKDLYQETMNSSRDKLASIAKGAENITRSMIKKIVMTIPYNVSSSSAYEYLIEHFIYDPADQKYKTPVIPGKGFRAEEVRSIAKHIHSHIFEKFPRIDGLVS
jgi:hypothetical protein